MVDINDLLPQVSDWKNIEEAWAINNNGQIVGRGWNKGRRGAFIMSPVSQPVPEPATMLLLGTGLLGLLGFKRKKKV